MDGMTGSIRFDSFGRRSHFKLDVVEYFMGKFKKVGWWETGLGVTRTQSDIEKEAEIQKSLQFKTFIVASRIVSDVIQNLSVSTAPFSLNLGTCRQTVIALGCFCQSQSEGGGGEKHPYAPLNPSHSLYSFCQRNTGI
jgi:hypothetical protein